MTKIALLPMAALFLLLAACKNKKEFQREMSSDISEMCNCYMAGKQSSEKFMECSAMNEKRRDKYRSDNNALTSYDAGLQKCMNGR